MEGRVPPTADRNNDPLLMNSSSRNKQPSTKKKETYVVQIPRDAVYRIPPPENAKIVESYSKPQREKKNCTCCCWLFLALGIIGVVVGTFFAVSHLLYQPVPPEFSLTRIQAKNLQMKSPKSNQKSRPRYEISMLAENPNERFEVTYENAGKTYLVFNASTIAQGKFPETTQESKQSTKITLTLDGSKAKLSNDTRKSLDDDSTPKTMMLRINVPIELKSWLKTINKNINIVCDFKVNSLEGKKDFKSEDCEINQFLI